MADDLNSRRSNIFSTDRLRNITQNNSLPKLTEVNENYISSYLGHARSTPRCFEGSSLQNITSLSTIDQRGFVAEPYRSQEQFDFKHMNSTNIHPSDRYLKRAGHEPIGDSNLNDRRTMEIDSCKQEELARGKATTRDKLLGMASDSGNASLHLQDGDGRLQSHLTEGNAARRLIATKDELRDAPAVNATSSLSAAPDKKSQNQKLRPARSTLQRMKGDELNPALIEGDEEAHRNSSKSPSREDSNSAKLSTARSSSAEDIQRNMGTQFGFYPFPAHQQPGMRLAGPAIDRNNVFRPRASFGYGFEQRFLDTTGAQQQQAFVASSQQQQVPPSAVEQHNNYRFCSTDMVSPGSNNAKPSYRTQMFLQPPRQLVFGPTAASFPGHFQGTPSSEEGSSASPGDSSPYRDGGGHTSPKPDEHGKYDVKHRHKTKSESANQCSQCGKAFSSSSALAKHKLIHSDERRYVCQTCSKGFKRQDHLNGHMITHRDKKPYECRYPDCDKSYCDMRSLRRHLENHHQAAGGDFPSSTSPPFAIQHGPVGMMTRSPYLDLPENHSTSSITGSIDDEHERPASLPNASVADTKTHPKRSSSDDEGQSERSTSGSERIPTEHISMGSRENLAQGDSHVDGNSDVMKPRYAQFDARNAQMFRDMNQQQSGFNGSNPYLLQSYMAQRFPWSGQAFAGGIGSQNALPFLMGLQQQQQQQQQQHQQQQQYFPPTCFPNSIPSVKPEIDKNAGRKDILEPGEIPVNSDATYPPNSLSIYPGSFAGRRGAVLTPEMLMQNNNATHPFYPNAFGTPTNPTAIAVAAAKTGSFYYQPREGSFPGGPLPSQYSQLPREGSAGYTSVSPPETNTSKSPAVTPSGQHPVPSEMHSPMKGSPVKGSPMAPYREGHASTMPKDIATADDFRGPVPSVPISSRKAKPHPGPIVIPASVNNKVCHSISSVHQSSRVDSPMKGGIQPLVTNTSMPVYTPPAMLSPRSIFFTGTCGTPRSSHAPSTPARLLNSARRRSVAGSVMEQQQQQPEESEVVFPEPKINVGPQFQAEVSDKVASLDEAAHDVHKASLLWSPMKEDNEKSREVEAFLELARSAALFGGSTNQEYALHILHRKRGNVKESIRLLLSRRHLLRADDVNGDYHYLGSTRWSAKERLAFRLAFRTKRKVFADIQKEVGTKTVAQCVEFYYLWKAVNPEGFRSRTRCVEVESEQEEEESRGALPLSSVPGEDALCSEAVTTATTTTTLSPENHSLGLYSSGSPRHENHERLFECDYPECRARFVSRQALNGHIRVHGGSFSKPIEAKRLKTSKPTVIITPSPGKHSENSVPRKRKSPSPAPRQQRPPAPPATHPDGTLMQFACKVCGRVFNKVKSRSAHMKTHVVKRTDDSNDQMKRPSVITQGVRVERE